MQSAETIFWYLVCRSSLITCLWGVFFQKRRGTRTGCQVTSGKCRHDRKDVSVRRMCHSADGLRVKAPLFVYSPPSRESALLNRNRGLELKSEAAPISWRINRGGKQCLDRSPSPTNTAHTNPCALQLSFLLLNSPSSLFFSKFYSPVMFYECSVRPKSKRNLLSCCDNVTNQREEQPTSNYIETTSQTYYLIGNLEVLRVL